MNASVQALVKIAEGHNDAAGQLALWGVMVLACLSEWHTEALARAGEHWKSLSAAWPPAGLPGRKICVAPV